MKIAILGRQPAIGIAELESIYGGENIQVLGREACLIDTPKINISHFGSILKVGQIVQEISSSDWRTISEKIIDIFVRDFRNANGKITLGVSVYGGKISPLEIQKTASIIKNKLNNSGTSLRTVPASTAALSTAVSHNNKLGLSDKKIELIVIIRKGNTYLAVSEGAQNITAYAKRDQNRPKRDAFIGMLPPKLAQTMINLGAGAEQPQIWLQNHQFDKIDNQPKPQLLDPFCGTGTVLQEAALKGFVAHGSDLNPKMVDYSRENLKWLETAFHPHGQLGTLETAVATDYTWNFASGLNTVVCETYLGQPFSAPPSDQKLNEVRENCNRIISNFLKNLATQIPEGTQICIAVPAWKQKNGHFSHLPLIDFLSELGYNRKEFLRVKPHDLIYYRENQVVARELLVLIRSKNVKK